MRPQGAQALDAAPDYELWPEHGHAWRVFLGCATQWRKHRSPLDGRVTWEGLRYEAVEIVAARHGVPAELRDEVFFDIQVLEDEFLKIKGES